MNKHAREEFAKICKKNGDVKSARRYEEGLYNSLGAIDMDVLDNLLAEVKQLRETIDNYRDIADTCLHAIKAGGDIRSGTIMLIERNLKLITGDEQ